MLNQKNLKPKTLSQPSKIKDLVDDEKLYQKVCLHCPSNPQATKPFIKTSEIPYDKTDPEAVSVMKKLEEKSRNIGVPSDCFFCSKILYLAKCAGYDTNKFLEENR